MYFPLYLQKWEINYFVRVGRGRMFYMLKFDEEDVENKEFIKRVKKAKLYDIIILDDGIYEIISIYKHNTEFDKIELKPYHKIKTDDTVAVRDKIYKCTFTDKSAFKHITESSLIKDILNLSKSVHDYQSTLLYPTP